MRFDEPSTIRITCARSLGDVLAEEVRALGWDVDESRPTAVWTRGTLDDCMTLNLELRTALAVMFEVGRFRCTNPDELYNGTAAMPWEAMIPEDSYFSVMSKVQHETINNSMFPSLKVKDAIADRFTRKMGRRPNSGPDRHRCVVQLFWRGETAELLLNTSGRKLSDRGYRKMPGKAPIHEALAASILLSVGYDGSQPLVLPMCGSGTLAIEAALIATGRAPGLLDPRFAFRFLSGFDDGQWQQLRERTRRRRKQAPAPIIATDIDGKMIEAAQRNAATAGVDQFIRFEICDFRNTPIPEEPGLLVMNPEYGMRLGEEGRLRETYKAIGDFFKQSLPGYTAHVLTGNSTLGKCIGLRTSRKRPFFNADIECRLLEFELYAGSSST